MLYWYQLDPIARRPQRVRHRHGGAQFAGLSQREY